MKQNRAILLLEDGTKLEGMSLGKIGTTCGEICFNTSMTGYQEIFTDPSYYRQILIMTNTHIGNYGITEEDVESKSVQISGLVCRQASDSFSRKKATKSLGDYLDSNDCVGIHGIDTRYLVKHIRDKGAMNAIISSEVFDETTLMNQLKGIESMEGLALANHVSTSKNIDYNDTGDYKVALLDFGFKSNIADILVQKGCHVKVFCHTASVDDLLEWNPDGFMLSNGPGDPSVMSAEQEVIKELIKLNRPIFGICLGHQLLAIASGLSTKKMHHGHRGSNHPILNIETNIGEITSQNHGFVVSQEGVEESSEIVLTHTHLNDGSVAGIRYKNKPYFSVQYHPEASPGPHDSRYLFDDFIQNMKVYKEAMKMEIS